MRNYPCCVICGMEAVGWHGYIFFADSHEEYAGWCREHIVKVYANPIFENESALARFRQLHPILYGRKVAGKEIVFLQKATITEVTLK